MRFFVWSHSLRTLTARSFAAALFLGTLPAAGAEKPIRFDRDIRPLLSEHCYACHGPGKQEAGLRLDDGAAATA